MKKLYVCCPVKGREWKNVVDSFEKMKKIAEIVFEEELEIINPPLAMELKEVTLNDMARHLMNMAEADYFVGMYGWLGEGYRNIELENDLAFKYDIKRIMLDAECFVPDVIRMRDRVVCNPIDNTVLLSQEVVSD
jgi:hypothetical protein